MSLMVGWRASRVRSGGERAVVSGQMRGSWRSWGCEWPSGVSYRHDVATWGVGSSLGQVNRRRKGGEKRGETYLGGGGYAWA